MGLQHLNGIVKDNLAIHLDLTNNKSWLNYDTGLTTISIAKWTNAISDNINLVDFGLTGFDNARTKIMWNGITLTPNDVYFSMYPIGNNIIKNPTTGETSGMTITNYKHEIIPSISGETENYFFDLHGGYLQGFFKLQDYNYSLLPTRYSKGITIETMLYLYSNSYGIFYMMGARAEDKYNSYFTGETITGTTTNNITGVTTTQDNYLNAIINKQVNKKNFRLPEESKETIYYEESPINNLKNNVIAFELTEDKRLGYKYINDNGQIISNYSNNSINTTGFTMIDIVFAPDDIIAFKTDCDNYNMTNRRAGKLRFFVNGRLIWSIENFPEFYFYGFSNDKEKQIGVPYSISWGGGSFGLKNSWHYDYQTYVLYNNQDGAYINNNFVIVENPINGAFPVAGLQLSADTQGTITVMRVTYTGSTGNTYYIKFNKPISTLSNRNYTVRMSIYDDEFFKNIDNIGNSIANKITILPYSDSIDISIVGEINYEYPISARPAQLGQYPFSDLQEYEYVYLDGIMYYGTTGLPVYNIEGYTMPNISNNDNSVKNFIVTGQKDWKELKCTFKTENNSGQNFINIGLLIETTGELNLNNSLYIRNFIYTASDILVQDPAKNMLLIEQNFDMPFVGGIQKLRIYDNALSNAEILHNATIEFEAKSNNLVSKGGRIIYR